MFQVIVFNKNLSANLFVDLTFTFKISFYKVGACESALSVANDL